MPCRDYTTDEQMQQQLRLNVDEMRSLAKTLKIKLDETTRLLCKATTTMANAGFLSDPELYRWHSKHIEEDRKP